MAAGLNKITVIGNLGKDPEVRFTQGGTAVCTMRIGVTERRKEGESYKDHTEWFSIICFGKTAETAGQYLKKGRQIYAEGRLQTRNWEDREKQTRTSVEIVANQIIFLGSAKFNDDTFNSEASSSFGSPSFAKSSAPMDDDTSFNDDDIPF